MINDIFIDKAAFEKLKQHVSNAYPYEGCGLLLTDKINGPVTDICIMDNITGNAGAHRHFSIDPLDVYNQERQADEKGLRITGFFHSHPDCKPVVSDEDEQFMIPGMVYLIVSVINGICGEIRGYLKDGPDEEIYSPDIRTDKEVE